MSLDVLAVGKLFGKCVERTSRNGNRFVCGKLRTPMRNGEAVFTALIAFSDGACAALLELDADDAVAVVGELVISAYLSKGSGEPKPGAEVLVSRVLTTYEVTTRKRRATQPTPQNDSAAGGGRSAGRDPDLDDDVSDIPF